MFKTYLYTTNIKHRHVLMMAVERSEKSKQIFTNLI